MFNLFSRNTACSLLILLGSALYHSLDPHSITQHLAFYQLYPESHEGKKALAHAWDLLNKSNQEEIASDKPLPLVDIHAITSLVTREPADAPIKLSEDQLKLVEEMGKRFPNRKLKGSSVWDKKELADMPTEEIDLARAILLYQFEDRESIRQYEATLDLMALQILVRLKPNTTPEEKIREINSFIFQEMRFRFPPHSLYAKDIDLYTFLPSVLDSRQGVCLGVSILYLCLAQRLDLPLEIITPPGHIYLRHRTDERTINIETTARGINLPSEEYLGVNTRKLEKRTIKEVVGMAFMNYASIAWSKENYPATADLYDKARIFLPDDPLIKMLQGFSYVFIGKVKEGKAILQEIRDVRFPWAISKESLPDDYLNGKVNAEGIKAIFLPVDETRESITKKQKELQAIVKRYPHFRGGIMHLAITWLQLGRGHEALQTLLAYHRLDPSDCTVEYYLTILTMQRYDYPKSWEFFKNTENLLHAFDHHPKALRELKLSLRRLSPIAIKSG